LWYPPFKPENIFMIMQSNWPVAAAFGVMGVQTATAQMPAAPAMSCRRAMAAWGITAWA